MVVNFNKKIYNVLAIQEAIKTYQKICKINLKEEKKYIKVYFPATLKNDIDFISREFCNYVLVLTKKYE